MKMTNEDFDKWISKSPQRQRTMLSIIEQWKREQRNRQIFLQEDDMEYTKQELEAMLEMVRQKIAEQGRIVDARLLEKERNLEQAIKDLEVK